MRPFISLNIDESHNLKIEMFIWKAPAQAKVHRLLKSIITPFTERFMAYDNTVKLQ